MPVAAAALQAPPPDATAPAGSVVPATTAPSPGFAAALGAQGFDPSGLPSVSLGQMVASFAGEPLPIGVAGSGNAGGIATAGGVSDAWGAASNRPAGVDTGIGATVLDAGERYLGVPYLWGGTDPAKGFDCSGFVQQVYADLGVKLPRVSIDQSKMGVEVGSLDAARPGDLVFWRGNGSRPNHIGIYAGDGKMLVAPRSGDVVRYQEITRTPDAVRRVIG
jgi:peptidoglycan DL-endopeptidase CwlO